MFKEMLETVIEHTEGSLGALIMGIDGIAVEKVLGEANDLNLDIAAAEFTSLVRSSQRAGNRHRFGRSARTDDLTRLRDSDHESSQPRLFRGSGDVTGR